MACVRGYTKSTISFSDLLERLGTGMGLRTAATKSAQLKLIRKHTEIDSSLQQRPHLVL